MPRPTSWIVWVVFALALLLAPRVFGSSLGVTTLSQMGIAIIACLSYNILLGQGGMLSFGHAVYAGLGAFAVIHALHAVSAGSLAVPVSALPLLGGVAGMAVAVLLGFISTRNSGTAFAMITLGLGELVFALATLVPTWFGGEAGVSANRVAGAAVLGITFGPALQVYYLIAAYTGLCAAAMYAFTQTPLGRLLNAVRDNAERVAFIGYNPQTVRYLAFIIAGFFAGISGGLAALNFEIVNAEVLGTARSGAYLLFTFLGGTTVFFGPIIGAVLMVLALVLFSELSQAWLLYLGLIFMLMVLHAPGGVASVLTSNWRLARQGKLRRLLPGYLRVTAAAALALAGFCAMVEMVYALHSQAAPGAVVLGLLDARSLGSWLLAAVLMLLGLGGFEWARRRCWRDWQGVQHAVEPEASREGSA